jgi:hypothetical protein
MLVRTGAVIPVPIGKDDDALVKISGGSAMDKPWGEQYNEFKDTLEAWRVNPLARRLVGLITAYSVGNGITLSATYAPLTRYIQAFWNDPQNNMLLREQQWSEELSRAGELFVTLHTNPASGMAYVRAIPASVIDKIEFRPGDYESELAYHEVVGLNDPDYNKGGRVWISPNHPDADKPGPEGKPIALMLHYAINRPVGCLRGESDLAPILLWLRRYSHWLSDRVELNAVSRAFVWIVSVKNGLVEATRKKYAHAPAPGSVLVVEEEEKWETITPDIKAADAANDGKAIRWMIVAGSPGLGLIDFGEADEANLATAKAMAEQRRRFMGARQAYFGFLLANTVLVGYNRAVRLGLWKGKEKALSDIVMNLPDIASEDNRELGTAAAQLANALTAVRNAGFAGDKFKTLFLRAVVEAAGGHVDDADLAVILEESKGAMPQDATAQKAGPPNMAPAEEDTALAALATGDSAELNGHSTEGVPKWLLDHVAETEREFGEWSESYGARVAAAVGATMARNGR